MKNAMQLKAKIKNLALKNKIPAQAVLQNFMLERLLERVSKSTYRDNFILKGGMLIASIIGIGNRTTMDMDATIRGYPLCWLLGLSARICEVKEHCHSNSPRAARWA